MKPTYQPSLNELQTHILTQLIINQKLNYSQIKPIKVENDLFNYHLQQLVKKGLIEKNKSSYSISEIGKRMMANFDALGNMYKLFRCSVALHVIREINDQIECLMQRRARQPFLGDVNGVAGKILKGEKVTDAASRKLEEETGLIADFQLMGVQRKIKKSEQEELLEDVLYHVCFAKNPDGQLKERTVFGENFWVNIDEVKGIIKSNNDNSPTNWRVYERILDKDFSAFYWEDEYIVERY